MMTPRGVSDVHVYTPERVEARYGIRPEQIPDFIGLKGDTLRQHPRHPGHRRQDGRAARGAVRLARGRARARRRALARARARDPRARRPGARRRSCSRRCAATSRSTATRPRSCSRRPTARSSARCSAASSSATCSTASTSSTRRCPRRSATSRAPRCAWREGELPPLARPRRPGDRRRPLRGRGGGRASSSGHGTRPSTPPAGRRGRGARLQVAAAAHDRAGRGHDDRRVPDRARPGRVRGRRARRRVRRRAGPRARGRGGDDRARPARRRARGGSRRCCASGSPSAAPSTSTATIELPLTAVLAAMEDVGVRIDTYRMGEITARLRDRVEELEAKAHELAGEEFMLGSTQQVARILFEKLELTPGRKGKTGYSTDTRVLRSIRGRPRDRPGARGVARVLEAAQHLPRAAAEPHLAGRRPPAHDLQPDRRLDRPALDLESEPAGDPDPHRARARDPLGLRRRAGSPAALGRLLPGRAAHPRPRLRRAEAARVVRARRGHPPATAAEVLGKEPRRR